MILLHDQNCCCLFLTKATLERHPGTEGMSDGGADAVTEAMLLVFSDHRFAAAARLEENVSFCRLVVK